MKQNSRRTVRGQLQATSQSSLRQSRLHILTFISYSPEIPDFLDADECELIIALAENKRLRDNPKITDSRGILNEDPVNTFKLWDLNGDDYIDTEEVSGTVHPLKSKILFVSVYCCLLNPLQSSVVSKNRFSYFTFSVSLSHLQIVRDLCRNIPTNQEWYLSKQFAI